MNNLLNVIGATAAASGTATGGTPAAAAGDDGVFAQLMGSLTMPPVALAEGAAAKAMPGGKADAARRPAQTESDVPAVQPDAALVAALLGQLQMPYVMPAAPSPALPGDDMNRATPSEPVPVLSGAATIPTVAAIAVTPGTAGEADADTALSGLPATALHDDAAAALSRAAEPASPAKTYQAAGGSAAADVVSPAATGDLKANVQTTPDGQTPPARDVSLAPAAATAAVITANPRLAMPPAAPSAAAGTSTDGENGQRPAASRDEGAAAEAIARPATAQAYADLRRMLESQSSFDERESPTAAVAAPAATSGAAKPSRGGMLPESADRIGDFATVAAGVPAALATRGEAAASQFTLAPHVHSSEWQPAFAGNVKLLVNEGTSSATLQLNPADFGPIDVRIVITDQRADIAFTVTHPDANAAIQSALSELRDQLAQSGIQLGHTSVGAHSQQPQHPRQAAAAQQRAATAAAADAAPADSAPRVRAQGNGTIDIYA